MTLFVSNHPTIDLKICKTVLFDIQYVEVAGGH